MDIKLLELPTASAIRARQKARPHYVFRLDERQVASARGCGLPDSAILALSAIAAASYGDREGQWVTLPQRTMDCMARSYRWWFRATSALEKAGMIDVRRHPGRRPRYRIRPDGQSLGCSGPVTIPYKNGQRTPHPVIQS